MEADWTKFKEDGFTVVRGLLESKVTDQFLAEFSAQARTGRRYSSGFLGRDTLRRIEPWYIEQLRGTSAVGSPVDRASHGVFFRPASGTLGWHQDNDSIYLFQTYNYVNVWIPLSKPQIEKTNVCVIPFRRLRESHEDAWRYFHNRGATGAKMVEGKTKVIGLEFDGTQFFDLDLESIAETPHLDRGDALILRGDVVHRSQDGDTDRVALSLRFVDSSTRVSRSKLLAGGIHKWTQMLSDFPLYESMLQCFEANKESTIALGDLLTHVEQAGPSPSFPLLLRAAMRQIGIVHRELLAQGKAVSRDDVCSCKQCSDFVAALTEPAGS